MDILAEYVEQNLLSKATLLKFVDDYSIYSHYIGTELELYTKYSSPLRLGDDDPSFSLYYSKYLKDQIWFKDQSTGKYGDVFKFLQELMGAELREVLLQINSDFDIGLEGEDVPGFKARLVKTRPLAKNPVKIEVTGHKKETVRYLNYWGELEIPLDVRDLYYCKDVQAVHYINEVHTTIAVRELTISYEILGTYKVYQPFGDRKYKFRNNYLSGYVEGAMQLKFHKPFAIITKATKECMFFRAHWDWEAVAGTSENCMISPHFMEVLRANYPQVFIWLDGDGPGIVAQARYMEMYPWLRPVVMDSNIEQKDPTDFYLEEKREGAATLALTYLETLITDKLE
jgi:hypothetical protein